MKLWRPIGSGVDKGSVLEFGDGWMDRCVGTWWYLWYDGNCARYYLFGFGVGSGWSISKI